MSKPHTEGSLLEIISYKAKTSQTFLSTLFQMLVLSYTSSDLMTLASICGNASLTSRSSS